MKNTQRLIPLQGAYNLRDLGGYRTQQGTTVKWEMVYRAGELDKLTGSDIATMEQRNLKTIIDFRIDDEIIQCPDADIATVTKRVELPIDAGNMIDIKKFPPKTEGREFMKEMNRVLALHGIKVYSDFFKILSDARNAPLLFHCSAGKDRTGFGAALFLSALGVDRPTIIEDYMLSEKYLLGKYNKVIEKDPFMAPMMTVEQGYIESALETIDANFGGMDKYLKNTLGADIELLRKIYTE